MEVETATASILEGDTGTSGESYLSTSDEGIDLGSQGSIDISLSDETEGKDMVLQGIAPTIFFGIVEGEQTCVDINAHTAACRQTRTEECVQHTRQCIVADPFLEIRQHTELTRLVSDGTKHIDEVQSEASRQTDLSANTGLIEPLHTRQPLFPVVAFQRQRQTIFLIHLSKGAEVERGFANRIRVCLLEVLRLSTHLRQ